MTSVDETGAANYLNPFQYLSPNQRQGLQGRRPGASRYALWLDLLGRLLSGGHPFSYPENIPDQQESYEHQPYISHDVRAGRLPLTFTNPEEVSNMFIDERADSFSHSLTLMTFAVALSLTGTLVLVGCDSSDVTEEPEVEIAAVAISPDSVSIEVGESVEFSVVALTAAGDTIPDADLDLEWWSTDTDVFTVEAGGVATGQEPGEAYCMIEATNETAGNLESTGKMAHSSLLFFTGRDSAFVRVLF